MASVIPVDTRDRHRRNILKKLLSAGAFRKGHLLSERLQHGVPAHERGLAKDVLQELVREGLVFLYGVTEHGAAYQLNVKRLAEIEEEIARGSRNNL